jgi:predicted esterase
VRGTGKLEMPTLTLHNTWDPAVPLFHEAALAQAVQAAGATHNLVQRQVPTYGHCEISGPQVVAAFGDLTTWVNTGNKP